MSDHSCIDVQVLQAMLTGAMSVGRAASGSGPRPKVTAEKLGIFELTPGTIACAAVLVSVLIHVMLLIVDIQYTRLSSSSLQTRS